MRVDATPDYRLWPPTAIVHDWLVTYAGAERVLEQMLAVAGDAELFALVDFLAADERGFVGGREATTSFVQRLPFARSRYRSYLPLMTFAVEQFDMADYPLVLSSSHAVAKGVLTGPDQLHLCMCYSPIRYAWDLQHQYLRQSGLDRGIRGMLARWMLHRIRMWDVRTANGVDGFIAISHFIARRIRKVYGRDATVIYPPVAVGDFPLRHDHDDYYVTASRFVPYKRIDLIAAAFTRMRSRRLVIIGDGPEVERVRAASGPNVELLGYQPQEVMQKYLSRARAFVFAAEEDFGIVPIEAQSCGTPVIAYGKGGALETIRGEDSDSPTGVFFSHQSEDSLMAAVERFERQSDRFTPDACRENALRFSPERFRREFRDYLEQQWTAFQRNGGVATSIPTSGRGP